MSDEELAEMLMVVTHLLVRADNLLGDLNKDFLTYNEREQLLQWAKKLKVEAAR